MFRATARENRRARESPRPTKPNPAREPIVTPNTGTESRECSGSVRECSPPFFTAHMPFHSAEYETTVVIMFIYMFFAAINVGCTLECSIFHSRRVQRQPASQDVSPWLLASMEAVRSMHKPTKSNLCPTESWNIHANMRLFVFPSLLLTCHASEKVAYVRLAVWLGCFEISQAEQMHMACGERDILSSALLALCTINSMKLVLSHPRSH